MSDYEPKCKKTLPIIFDDRMPASNLTPKLVGRVNDNTEDLKNLYEETETIQGDIDSLQEDVDDKLNIPETAGTAGQVLTSDGEGGAVWASVGSGEIVVDPTLTVEGAAADAKKTGDEITHLKQDNNELKTDLAFATDVTQITFTPGYYINLSGTTADVSNPSASELYAYAVVNCSNGNEFTIDTTGGVNPRAYAFIDSNGNILEVAESQEHAARVIIAPATASKLILNGAIADSPVAYKGVSISNEVKHITNILGFDKMSVSVYKSGVYYPADYVTTKTLGTSANFGITDKIRIAGYNKIVYSGLTAVGTSPHSVWFDSGKNPISVFKQNVGINELEIPSGAEYVAFSISRSDSAVNINAYDDGSLVDNINALTAETENILTGSAEKMAWSWWVTNRCVDSRGVLYFGFVSEDAYIGVGMRYPSGMTFTKKLAKTANKDDHNAPAVNLLSDGTVLVTGSDGHGVNNHRFVFLSNEPYTIDCNFTDKSFYIPASSGNTVQTTYAQTFVLANDTIYTMYRHHSYNGTTHKTAWCMLVSADNGDTWENYVFMYADLYCLITDTTAESKKNILVIDNPVTAENAIRGGYVDLLSKTVYADDGTVIMTMPNVPASGDISGMGLPERTAYTILVADEMSSLGLRHRLLAAIKQPYGNHVFLWAKSTDTTMTNFKYYRYDNGDNLELGESGKPLYLYSSYIGGADFGYDKNNVIYCQNVDNTTDGTHVIRKVVIDNGAIASNVVIESSKMSLSRPFTYDGDRFIVMIGHYYDTSTLSNSGNSFTAWQFDAMFA